MSDENHANIPVGGRPWCLQMFLSQFHHPLLQPFQESLGGLGQLSFGLVLWINDGRDMVVEEVAPHGAFKMGWEIAEGIVVSLLQEKVGQVSKTEGGILSSSKRLTLNPWMKHSSRMRFDMLMVDCSLESLEMDGRDATVDAKGGADK